MPEPIEVTTSIEIDAPPSAVWDVLTDVEHFHDWNPFIRDAHGATTLGGTLRLRVRPRPQLPLRVVFHATVLERDAPRKLRWQGQVLAPWLGSGDHVFEIEPIGDGRSRFVQREQFAGLLPHITAKLLVHEARRGFDAMNQALKRRVEHARAAA